MSSSPHSVNPLGRAPRRPSSTRRAQFNAGPRKYLGIAHVSLVVLASFASRVAAIDTTVKSIVVGATDHTCALMDDSSLMCWGSNNSGKLGVLKLPNTYVTSPVGPVNLGSGRTAKAISAGYQHTCAILDDDTLKCWGSNYNGRVGVGSSDQLIWDPTEVKFDGSSSSGGSAGAPGPSGLNGTSGAPGPAGPKGDERTFTVAAAALIVAVIWPVVLVAYLVRQRASSPRATKAAGAKPRLFDQPIDVESRL